MPDLQSFDILSGNMLIKLGKNSHLLPPRLNKKPSEFWHWGDWGEISQRITTPSDRMLALVKHPSNLPNAFRPSHSFALPRPLQPAPGSSERSAHRCDAAEASQPVRSFSAVSRNEHVSLLVVYWLVNTCNKNQLMHTHASVFGMSIQQCYMLTTRS